MSIRQFASSPETSRMYLRPHNGESTVSSRDSTNFVMGSLLVATGVLIGIDPEYRRDGRLGEVFNPYDPYFYGTKATLGHQILTQAEVFGSMKSHRGR
ncbi:MAG: hypothetical protein WCO33_02995 [bacterium]